MRVSVSCIALGISFLGVAGVLFWSRDGPSSPSGRPEPPPGAARGLGGTGGAGQEAPDEPGEAEPSAPEAQTAPSEAGGVLTGRVLKRSEPPLPAPGVTVHLKPTPRRSRLKAAPPPRSAATGADGRFEFPAVQPGFRLQIEVDEPSSARRALAFELSEDEAEARQDLGDLVLEPAASLVVKLADADGAEIAGATVLAEPTGSSDSRWQGDIWLEGGEIPAWEASAGEYRLEHLPVGEFWVYAYSPGYAWGYDSVKLPREKPLVLQLTRGHRIAGTVRAADGTPIEGAVLKTLDDTSPELEVISDAFGSFAFDMLRDEAAHVVSVEARGFLPTERSTLPGKDDLEFWLAPQAVFSGMVVSDEEGSPLAGAQVSVESIEASSEAQTRRDGRFEVREIPPGTYSFVVDHDEYLPLDAGSWRIAEGTRITDQRFRLKRGLSTTGKVVDSETGEPIFGARATLHLGSSDDAPSIWRSSWTGEDGSFSVAGLREGVYGISAEAEGYLVATALPASIPPQGEEELTIALDRGGSISVRVLGPEGAGLPEASISLSWPNPRSAEESAENTRVCCQARRNCLNTLSQTDLEGNYTFKGLPSFSRYVIEAGHEDYPPARLEGIIVEAGRETERIEIQLQRGGTIRGRVVDEKGRGIADVRVCADQNLLSESSRTEVDGRYEITGLPPGSYQVHAWPDSRPASEERSVEIGDGETAERIDLVVCEGLSLSGRVTEKSGAAVAGSAVWVEVGDQRAWAETDAEGRFQVRGLRAGKALVSAKKVGHEERVVRATVPGGEVLVTLDRWARIAGRVEAPAAGAALSGSLEAFPRLGRWMRSRSTPIDATGRFDLDLEPGQHLLEVHVPGFAQAGTEVSLKPGERRDLVIALLESGTVEGTVVDLEKGEPLKGVQVAPRAPAVSPLLTAETDSSGHFELERVPAGLAVLVARHSRCRTGRTAALLVRSRGTTSVRIELEQGEGPEGQVNDPEPGSVRVKGRVFLGEAPLGRAKLYLDPPGMEIVDAVNAQAEEDGRYEVVLPGDGDFLLLVWGPDGESKGQDLLTVPPGVSEFEQDFVFSPLTAQR